MQLPLINLHIRVLCIALYLHLAYTLRNVLTALIFPSINFSNRLVFGCISISVSGSVSCLAYLIHPSKSFSPTSNIILLLSYLLTRPYWREVFRRGLSVFFLESLVNALSYKSRQFRLTKLTYELLLFVEVQVNCSN